MIIKRLFLVLTLSGCATYKHVPLNYQNEISALEKRTTTAIKAKAIQALSTPREWFPISSEINLSDGLSFAEANALALFYSPKIISSRAEHNIAGSRLIAAGLLPNPDLFLGPRISTRDSSLIFPGSLSFPLSLFGQRSAEIGVAKAALDESNMQTLLTEIEVLEETSKLFFNVTKTRQEIAIREEYLATYDTLSRWVEALFQSAAADNSALFLASAERDKAFAALEQNKSELVANESELLKALGLLPQAVLIVVDGALLESRNQTVDKAPEQPNHPRLLAAKAAYDRASQELGVEIAKQYPDFRFGFEGESDDGDLSLGLGLGASLPIFNSNQTGISAARSRLEIAREKYRTVLLELSHSRSVVRSEVQAAERILENLRQNRLARLNEAHEALQVRLAAGDGDILETLSATNALSEARLEEISLTVKLAELRLREAVLCGEAFQSNETTEMQHE